MASSSASQNHLAEPSHLQGMSPTVTTIEGEVLGPDYGRSALEPLRDSQNECGVQGVAHC